MSFAGTPGAGRTAAWPRRGQGPARWLVLACLLGASAGWAQRFTYRQYGSREGLTNLAIRSLLQDRAGFLWVGTDNGLFRYDGQRFRGYFLDDGLPSTEVYGLAEAPDGTLWATTAGGALVRRRGDRFEAVPTGSTARLSTPPGLGLDRAGRLYLAQPEGLVRGEAQPDGSFRFRLLVPGAVQALSVRGDEVHVAVDRKLLRWTEQGPEPVGAEGSLPAEDWRCLLLDGQGNLWARASTRLLVRPRGQARFVDRSAGLPPFSKNSCTPGEDQQGRIYLPTDHGVAVLDGGRILRMEAEQGLPGESSTITHVDRDGSLWVGTFGQGLVRRLGSGAWLSWKREDGLRHNTIWAILRARSGLVWVGSTGGLDLLGPDDRVVASWTQAQGLSGEGVNAVVESAEELLVATTPAGVTRFSPEGLVLGRVGREGGLQGDQVTSLALDREGRLWAVGSAGCFRSRAPVVRGQPLRFEAVPVPGLPGAIRQVLVDAAGTVWLATPNGLARFDGSTWTVLSEAQGLRSGNVAMVAEDRGALWVSYRDPLGLTRLEGREGGLGATHFPLPGRVVFAIEVDREHRLWVSTDNGVYSRRGEGWTHLDTEDGLIWDDGDDMALHADARGQVWVGTSNGLSRFAPGLAAPPEPPVAQLSQVTGEDREYQPGESPVLPYARRSLRLRFGALSYGFENRMRFRYRLLGQDEGWRETGEKSIAYAGLAPGRYDFQLLAGTPDGQWSATPAELRFTIEPPWWWTWWFLGLAALGLGGAAWGGLTWRVRGVEAQRRLLERLVEERTAEARAATRAKSEFLANMSHEIRTPMNAVIGMTDLLAGMDLPEEAAACVGTVRASGEALLAIINDILDFSKIESGKLQLERQPCDLARSVREVLAVAAATGGSKGLRLEAELDPGLPAALETDPLRLRQVLLNLLSNAVKFTERGSVRVAVRPEAAGGEEAVIRFEVRDTGIGIPEAARGALFKEFSQADPSTTRRFGGTGLGLAISKRLVEALGGEIGVESQPGVGSTFHFTVRGRPLPASALPAPEAPAVPGPAAAPLAILLAEDNPINQKVTTQLLERLGYHPDLAADGEEVLRAAERRPYDLILMDVHMPRMDGLEATRRLRAKGARTRIVALTAGAFAEDQAECLAAGMDGFLSKPLRLQELRTALGA